MTDSTQTEPQGTGDCFVVAGNATVNSIPTDDSTVLLCHGLVTRVEDGLRHSHAWLEVTTTVDFPGYGPMTITHAVDRANGNNANLPIELYYKIGKIEHDAVRRYTVEEAMRHMLASKHFGPWEPLS